MANINSGCVCEVYTCIGGAEYATPEGRERRLMAGSRLCSLTLMQIVASGLCILVGIVQIGIALPNPHYPQINTYAFVNGILVFIGSIYGKKSVKNGLSDVGAKERKYIMVHYVMNVLSLTFSSLQMAINGWAVGECFSTNEDLFKKCAPLILANGVVGIVVIVLGFIMCCMCVYGTIVFCLNARCFGFTNQYEDMNTMRKEIDSLRQRVQDQEKTDNRGGSHVSRTYEAYGGKGF